MTHKRIDPLDIVYRAWEAENENTADIYDMLEEFEGIKLALWDEYEAGRQPFLKAKLEKFLLDALDEHQWKKLKKFGKDAPWLSILTTGEAP